MASEVANNYFKKKLMFFFICNFFPTKLTIIPLMRTEYKARFALNKKNKVFTRVTVISY